MDNTESQQDSGRGVAGAVERLATYGTLAPGRPNHHQLAGLEGRWLKGHVDGLLVEAGWGASLGYPALVIDPAGSAIGVDVFESIDLPAHWARLDAFEGPGCERFVITETGPTWLCRSSRNLYRCARSTVGLRIRPIRPLAAWSHQACRRVPFDRRARVQSPVGFPHSRNAYSPGSRCLNESASKLSAR